MKIFVQRDCSKHGGDGGGVVTNGEGECLTDLVSEAVVVCGVPVLKSLLNVSIDLRVVPEEVVGDALCEDSGGREDCEELAELLEVLGDAATVVASRGEVLEELSNVHDSLADADCATCLEVNDCALDVSNEGVSAAHATEQVVQVVLVKDSVHHSCEHSDHIATVEGVDWLLETHQSNACCENSLLNHLFWIWIKYYYITKNIILDPHSGVLGFWGFGVLGSMALS